MSKTIRSTVTFSLKQVFQEDALEVLRKSREEAREILKAGLPKGTHGSQKAMIEMFASDLTEEQLLERVIRAGVREFLAGQFIKELNGDGQKASVGSVTVSFKEPLKVTPACELHDASKACTALCERLKVQA